jgi:hypothetical protein
MRDRLWHWTLVPVANPGDVDAAFLAARSSPKGSWISIVEDRREPDEPICCLATMRIDAMPPSVPLRRAPAAPEAKPDSLAGGIQNGFASVDGVDLEIPARARARAVSDDLLKQFFRGYFGQDWDLDGISDWRDVVMLYASQHPTEVLCELESGLSSERG